MEAPEQGPDGIFHASPQERIGHGAAGANPVPGALPRPGLAALASASDQRRGPQVGRTTCSSLLKSRHVHPPESHSTREPVPVMTDAVDARSRRLRAERIELIGWLAGAVA